MVLRHTSHQCGSRIRGAVGTVPATIPAQGLHSNHRPAACSIPCRRRYQEPGPPERSNLRIQRAAIPHRRLHQSAARWQIRTPAVHTAHAVEVCVRPIVPDKPYRQHGPQDTDEQVLSTHSYGAIGYDTMALEDSGWPGNILASKESILAGQEITLAGQGAFWLAEHSG